VAGEDPIQALLVEHIDGLGKAIDEIGVRGAGPEALLVRLENVIPSPEGTGHLGGLAHLKGLWTDGIEPHSWRHHQALLRTGHGHVHTPFIELELHASEGRDGVHQEQCRVLGRINGPANSCNVRGDSGGGLVVDHADGFDRVLGISLEALGNHLGANAFAPAALHHLWLETESRGHTGPEGCKVPRLEHQDLIAGAECIDQRGLPGARAGGRVEHHRATGAKKWTHRLEHAQGKGLKLRASVVDGRKVDGPQDAVGHIGGSGDLQEMAALANAIEARAGVDCLGKIALHVQWLSVS